VNRARAGRSSRTFITEGLWEKVRMELKPGDYVLLQMGHNDGSPPDKDRARGSLPGLGDESQEFTLPNGTKEVVYTFGHYMRQMIAETKAAGASPMVLGLTCVTSGKTARWSEATEIQPVVRRTRQGRRSALPGRHQRDADQYDAMGRSR